MEAIAEAIALRLEAIANRLEALTIVSNKLDHLHLSSAYYDHQESS